MLLDLEFHLIMVITLEDVNKIADLARLQINPEEAAQYLTHFFQYLRS